jgi:hypothetical protein
MKPERVAWHAETPAPMKKYDSRCREDRISRSIWMENVTRRDRDAEKRRRIENLKRVYPEKSLYEIMRMLRTC